MVRAVSSGKSVRSRTSAVDGAKMQSSREAIGVCSLGWWAWLSIANHV